MYVEIGTDGAHVRDPDNCRSLDIRAADRQLVDPALRSSGLGRWDGGAEAELSVRALHDAAAAADVAADWPERWAAMIDYATGKGWVTPDGETVRAHLVELD